MHALASKRKPARQASSLDVARSNWDQTPRNDGPEADSAAAARSGHDFGRMPLHPGATARLQTKLTVNTPGDVYEQEADRVADTVMQGKDVAGKPIEDEEDVPPKKSAVAEKCGCGDPTGRDNEKLVVQRKGAGGAGPGLEPGLEIETQIQRMRGGGDPLPSPERRFMESRFGADFGAIRIHTSQDADACSRAVHARAFTTGSDIFFRAGEYTQGRSESRRLLAHELTHAVQQGATGPGPAHRPGLGAHGAAPRAVQRDLAVEPPNPSAVAPVLTEAQITEAIDFNTKHFNDPKSLEEIRDIIGISPTPAVSDRELALTIAQWQAEFNLTVDGKAGDLTVGTIVRELKAEGLQPDALKLLLDLHRNAPTARAALNFLPILMDQTPTGWGVTVNDDPVFDISVFARPGVWNCVITKADQRSHQGVRLLPGVVEVTAGLVAGEASCPRLQTMITSLNSVASQGTDSGFYMLAAVQAHENEHIRQYRAGLAPHYTTLRTAIEALTVPLASHNTAAAAKAAIKALPAFTTAMATFHAADVTVNNTTAAHTPSAPFNTVEHAVVDPMITTIRARRTALSCP